MLKEYILRTLLITPPVLLALTVHECAHAWAADRMGDPTARMLGRVTLNPIKHLDPIGTIVLLVSGMFGWAKPVPINPRNFKNPSRSIMWTAAAGPISNLMLAAVFAATRAAMTDSMGLTSALPDYLYPVFLMVEISILMNVSLAVFNMIPIPPLDGSRVLQHLLPADKALGFSRLEPYGFIILLGLMFTGILDKVVAPLVYLTAGLLTGGGF